MVTVITSPIAYPVYHSVGILCRVGVVESWAYECKAYLGSCLDMVYI